VNPADFTSAAAGSPTAPGDGESRPAGISAAPPLTPLTGRDTEVGLLVDRWEQTQEGDGQVVMLVADAGLGKSRLVRTIKEIVLADVRNSTTSPSASPIIEWPCFERSQTSGLRPVADCLARELELTPAESAAARFDRLAHYLEGFGLGAPEVVALFAQLLFLPPDERYPAPGLSPAREREETLRAVREWLQACARRQPILFVVEDLHWIDASTLEFLAQFIGEGPQHRIFTILTFRPEFRVPWPTSSHQTTLALNRLTRRQVAGLLRGTAGGTLPDSLVAQIYERTGGVPLLVEEFNRMARESAIFEPAAVREMPSSLQQLVLGRLDRMSIDRDVAHLAATLGREFDFEVLAAATGGDEPTLRTELAKLENAEIVFRKGQPPRCSYLFKHTMLEEALRCTSDPPRQRQFHRRVAETMEAQFPHSVENQPELLAQHYTKAGLPEKAIAYWLQAGQRSQERCANVEAISHLTHGLDLLGSLEESPVRDERELEFLGPLGAAYIATRGYAAPEVGPVFRRARTLSEGVRLSPKAFTVLRGHFAYHIVRGDFRLCTDLASDALALASRLADPGMIMEALFLRGLTQLYRGDFAAAHETCARALAEYDDRERTAFWAGQTGENSGVGHRCYLALAAWHLGFPDQAMSHNREAQDLARTLRHPFSLEYALHHTGWLYQHCRLGAETQTAAEEEIRVAGEQGFLFWHASGTLYAGAGLLLRGRSEEGLRRFQEGLAAYRATGAGLGLPYYLSILGDAFTRTGQFAEARRALDEAFALVEKNDERFQEAELHRLQGELHLADGHDETAAAACFQRALEIARRQQSRAWELRAATNLARLRHRQGRRNEAFDTLSTIADHFTEGASTPDLVDAQALLKELGNERMRDDIAAGIKYVLSCIPPPMAGPVSVDWRYVPSSTLGGDAIGYHWVDRDHLALYLIDVTGHGLDSALLSVTITNVIRAGTLAGADVRHPSEVVAALNEAFQGSRHGYKFFTIWYGVYHCSNRLLTYASGGHPPAILIVPSEVEPRMLPATGPVVGIVPGMRFPATSVAVPIGSRLFIFSDGVFEIRRNKANVWNLADCVAYLTALSHQSDNAMDALLVRARELRGSSYLDDDFSIIEAGLRP
jgi:serine phosphatase RsbU (regulator of sigma subunit)